MSELRRRLAAILHADVVGYSRMMEQAETRTLRELQRVRREVWEPAIRRHFGRVVGTAGDAMLIEFTSAMAAVACAVDLQRGTMARAAAIEEAMRLRLRIGVNLGDVVVEEDGDLYGEGVNLAQRLGDIVAGTVVVETRSALSVNDTIFMNVAREDYHVKFPEVMRLSDRDINTIKNVITHSRKTNSYDMCNRIATKVQEVLKVPTDMYAMDFLEKARIMEGLGRRQTEEVTRLEETARATGFGVERTPGGLGVVPVLDGQPITHDPILRRKPSPASPPSSRWPTS